MASQEPHQNRHVDVTGDSSLEDFSSQSDLNEHLKQLHLDQIENKSSMSVAMFRIDSTSSTSSGATFSTIASSSHSSCVISTTDGVPVINLGHLASVTDMYEACEQLEQLHLVETLYNRISHSVAADVEHFGDNVQLDSNLNNSCPLRPSARWDDQPNADAHGTFALPFASLKTIPEVEVVGIAILPETPASIERCKLLPTLAETLDLVGVLASTDQVTPEATLPAVPPVALPAHLRRRRRSVDETGISHSPSTDYGNSFGASQLHALQGVGEVIQSSRLHAGELMTTVKPDSMPQTALSASDLDTEKRRQKLKSSLKFGTTALLDGQKSPGTGRVRVRFAE